ncbi:RAC family serine/threonine-protein kinase like protein [Tritrichomonas foetus]|uniref:non-specific serine/threonine protein kinase n=1 Tax=Tritrichomonas foetus TaxID=1144522 RepID=A0A1J4K214_9EUKA|nr:RAC family serine/threonine-protein kinase like protein [Tritrichomonas foetus]|eukprot:OHT05481.1 RAC family serine/threonine-protein kinase like protein [Tritrichomonas foetus]
MKSPKRIERVGTVVYSGTLKRKGAFFGILHSCFCELCNSALYVKRTKDTDKYELEIPITPETIIEVHDQEKMPLLVLTNPAKSPLNFVSDNTETITAWAVALRSCTLRPPPGITIDSFDIVSVIGRGFYGKVMLVKNKATGEHFAMKTIHKNRLFATKKVYTVINERNILVKANHPFIVQLYYSFQTETKFYFILEYAPGGELFKRLKENLKLSLCEARLYLAEIGLALEYLHSIGVVYRDLKTENILLDDDGHIKITDFGLSKDISTENEHTASFCGTPEYIAPEIIARDAYTYSVDWWSFGVLAYEMLYGCTPFYSTNRNRLMQSILRDEITFPRGATAVQKDFISKFLKKNPEQRAKFEDMKTHEFWDGLNFDDVLQKKVKPNFVPDIYGAESTNNFDDEFTQEPAADSFGSPVLLGQSNVPGFSYVAEPAIEAVEEDSPLMKC